MTAGEPTLISATTKLGDYQNTAFTLRAGSAQEFAALTDQLLGADAAAFRERFVEAFKNAPLYDISGGSSVKKEEPKQSGWGGSNSSSRQTQDDAPGKPSGTVPECDHGPKVWVNPPNKDWKGWFCEQKKRGGDCKAEFVND